MRWHQFTIRWFLIRIAVIAPALAFLAAAEREGRASGCGTPTVLTVTMLVALGLAYGLIRLVVRLVIFTIRHPS